MTTVDTIAFGGPDPSEDWTDDTPWPDDKDAPADIIGHGLWPAVGDPVDSDTGRPPAVAPSNSAIDVLTQAEALERYKMRSAVAVIPTGIDALDDVIGGGWPIGQVAVILGYSGSGKSELARQTARHAANTGHGVVHVDVELGAEQIIERDLAQASGVSPRRLREGGLTAEEVERLDEAQSTIAADAHTRTICPGGPAPLPELEEVIASAIAEIHTEKPLLVVIDSLQRIAAGAAGDSQRLQNQYAMWFAASLARKLGVAVVLVAEQARAKEGGRPSAENVLTSGAESRAIEYVSDVVLGLVPSGGAGTELAIGDTAAWERRVSVAVAKNRHGASGYLADDLVFRGPCWQMATEPRGQEDLEERISDALADGEIWPVAKLTKKVKRRKAHVLGALRTMLASGTVQHALDASGRPLGWRYEFPRPGTRGVGSKVPEAGNSTEHVSNEAPVTPRSIQGNLLISRVPIRREPADPDLGVPGSPYVVGEPEPGELP